MLAALRLLAKLGPGGQIGLNLGALGSGTKPGVPYVDYTGTSLEQYQRWAAKGIKLFRLGFLWERVQQTLSGPLDGPATAIITEQLDFAASVGECGAAGNDDQRWMSQNWSYGLASFLSRGWPVFVWSAGGGSTGSQTYAFSVEPLLASPTVDRPQWAYMEPLVRAFNN